MQYKLSFLGAACTVTGSRYLLETDNLKVLVDCGLYQERENIDKNWQPFPVSPRKIDAILLTHAHIDHCGFLPKLVHDGFHGKIYCTEATAEIAQIMLLDAAQIQEEDAAYKKRRHEREGRKGRFEEVPLYTVADARATFPLFSPVKYRKLLRLNDDVGVTFYDAGHVLGSAMIVVKLGKKSRERTILFSGDVGRNDKPMLEDPTFFTRADYVVIESTYGDRVHERPTDIADDLADIINSTEKAGGNLVVPSFALERSQEILYYLNSLLLKDRISHLMVYLDSPMAVRLNNVFQHHPELFDREMTGLIQGNRSPFDFPGLQMIQTADESKALNHIRGTVMIIAGAGMCTGGRIKHHLVANITRPESTILFVGYQSRGTLGREILDGTKNVRILGQYYPVRARIAQIPGLSSHADRDELFRWLSALKNAPRQVFVTHGERAAAESFAGFVREKTGWEVTAPEYGTEVVLK